MRVATNLGKLLICALVGGLLVAVAVFPGLFTIGTAAGFAGNAYLSLPSDLRTPPTYQKSIVYASDGKTVITEFYDEDRTDVPLSQVSLVMQQAVVAAEDTRFYEHGGVDLKAIVRALVANEQAGADSQGASTLTMQYVRNVLKSDPNLTPAERAAATADTLARKIQEARYAVQLEQTLTKQQILERYLNIAYFGDGAYGVEAAAETYFSTTAAKLTLPQATMLAGIIQSPDVDNPVTGDSDMAKARRGYVLNAMVGMKVITAQQATQTAAAPLGTKPSKAPNDCTEVPAAHNDWGYFCDYFVQWWDSQPAFGLTVADREASLKHDGWRITTSMNPSVEDYATKQSLSLYGYNDPKVLPIAVITPGTGRVLALAVNRHYSLAPNPGNKNYPNSVDQFVAGGGSILGYQTGSTYKIFTMLAALSSGLPLYTVTKAVSPFKSDFTVAAGSPAACDGTHYCPHNDNPSWMDGNRDMWDGFGRSVNTYFVWLEQQIGSEKAVAMAKKLGIVFQGNDAKLAAGGGYDWGAFTLGVVATTPLELANAYATVASGGIYCKPLPVLAVTDRDGQKLSVASPQCNRVVSANVAAAAADAARCPVSQQSYYGQCDGGTAPVAPLIMGNRPFAGKTGSSENNSTETFVGFTPQIAAAGIAADADNPTNAVGSFVSHVVDIAVIKTIKMALGDAPYLKFPVPTRFIAWGPSGKRPPPTPSPTPSSMDPGGPGNPGGGRGGGGGPGGGPGGGGPGGGPPGQH